MEWVQLIQHELLFRHFDWRIATKKSLSRSERWGTYFITVTKSSVYNWVRFVLLKQMCMVLTLAVLKVYFFHAFLFVLLFCFHFVVLCFLTAAGSLCILCFFFLPSFPSRYIIFSIPFDFFYSVLDFLFLNVTFSFLLNFYFLMLSVIHFHCFFFFLFLTSSFLQRRGFGKAGIIRYETGVCNWIRPGSAQNKIPHCWMWLALHIYMLLVSFPIFVKKYCTAH